MTSQEEIEKLLNEHKRRLELAEAEVNAEKAVIRFLTGQRQRLIDKTRLDSIEKFMSGFRVRP